MMARLAKLSHSTLDQVTSYAITVPHDGSPVTTKALVVSVRDRRCCARRSMSDSDEMSTLDLDSTFHRVNERQEGVNAL